MTDVSSLYHNRFRDNALHFGSWLREVQAYDRTGASHAYACATDGDFPPVSDCHGDADRYTDAHTDSYTDKNGHTHADSDCDRYRDANSNGTACDRFRRSARRCPEGSNAPGGRALRCG